MGVGHQQVLDRILSARSHADATLATARLPFVGIDRSAFQVPAARDGNCNVLTLYEIFQIDVACVFDNLGSALIPEGLLNLFQFADDNGSQLCLRTEDVEVFGDHALNFRQLIEDLLLLHSCQALELQLDDRLGLALTKIKDAAIDSRSEPQPLRDHRQELGQHCCFAGQPSPGFFGCFRGANQFDYEVEVVQRLLESEQEVLSLPRLPQQEVRAAAHDIDPVIDEALQAVK